MIDGYKIVTCGPVGRKRYLEILVRYLFKLKNIIDKHIFWINTEDQTDLNYINQLVMDYPDFFEIIQLDNNPDFKGNANVGRFYKYCTDPNTVYCKIDDDIVFLQLSKFEKFIRFRINNPQYFLIFANTLNSGLSHFLHNKNGAYDLNTCPKVDYFCMNRAWYEWQYAVFAFQQFQQRLMEDSLDRFDFGKWILSDYERHSINFISWMGIEFSDINVWDKDDEGWLSVDKPAEKMKPNCIYGGFLVVHYAFFTQREMLDKKTEILDFFNTLSLQVEMKNPA